MRSILLAITLLFCIPGFAQLEIPGENAGDEGWMLHGQDTLHLVRAADGHVWLQQDLGSSGVAASATDPLAQGALYQWGRWTDGHQLRTSATAQASTLATNDPAGLTGGSPFFFIGASPTDWWGAGSPSDTWSGTAVTATNGTDPCSELGVDWQSPSQDDWINILALEGITDLPSAFASHLKLTAAGSRDGQTGTILNAGQYGSYWSSSAAPWQYAWAVSIMPSFASSGTEAYRSYGMSVRCLHRSLHVGIDEGGSNYAITFAPNPTRDLLQVTSDRMMERVMINDVAGKQVLEIFPMAATYSIDLSQLPEGMYFARILSGGVLQGAKVMVVR
jgi:hypothetical protein